MPCFAGTGKTLVARALANECSRGTQRVAFFMRKGADCLSKWVGEAERQLRLLFDKVRCIASALNLFKMFPLLTIQEFFSNLEQVKSLYCFVNGQELLLFQFAPSGFM